MFGYATRRIARADAAADPARAQAHQGTRRRSQAADGRRGSVPTASRRSRSSTTGTQPNEVTAVVISTQHTTRCRQKRNHRIRARACSARACSAWWHNEGRRCIVNPTGSFSHGGPSADCGVTGRKIIVDSYGGWGRHGGGAFSGKDPSKVDRSSAYFCRYVASRIVAEGLAKKAEVQVGYAIGMAKPVSVKVDTFGTGDEGKAVKFVEQFGFRPRTSSRSWTCCGPSTDRRRTTVTSARPACPGRRRRSPSAPEVRSTSCQRPTTNQARAHAPVALRLPPVPRRAVPRNPGASSRPDRLAHSLASHCHLHSCCGPNQ